MNLKTLKWKLDWMVIEIVDGTIWISNKHAVLHAIADCRLPFLPPLR